MDVPCRARAAVKGVPDHVEEVVSTTVAVVARMAVMGHVKVIVPAPVICLVKVPAAEDAQDKITQILLGKQWNSFIS